MSENTDYETLKAERDAALNTCTLIAEALGITGAVAGDTIARVQQLVGENAALKERLAEKVKLPDLYWTFDDDKNPVLDADKVIFAIEQAGFAVADNSSDRFIAELANRTPATDAAIAEIKAQGVDEFTAKIARDLRMAGGGDGYHENLYPEFAEHLECKGGDFAASLRGEHEIKS
ncbi:hypothetical protein ABSL28_004467 [Yersinia enterocolitica]|uniref:hypothetical protein n=1 Tax=Yersinia enterocolitica TaxID=630 RepID=UPI002A4E4A64|nr:hypothetical protein [Yersinia enterocolitica]